MKFDNLVTSTFKSIIEQTPGNLNVQPDAAAANVPAIEQQPQPQQPRQDQQKTLTPEGKVWLVGLLRKALFLNPGDKSLSSLEDLPEVNETNASEVLQKILNVMDSYSTNINIDKLPKT